MKRFIINPEKTALVIIDMQEFSCNIEDASLKPYIDQVVFNINYLASECRRYAIPVIWVRHNINSIDSSNDGGFFQLFHDEKRTLSVMDYGPETEIFSGMNVDTTKDHIVFKNRYSAFLSSPPNLKQKLDELDRNQLIITGIAANVCVESTLRDAMQLDYEVTLISDGTIGTNETSYYNTLRNTQLFFGDVQSTTDIIRDISKDQNK